ncbi:hypothetical protein VP01_3236g1 [Puccinia sorghi]|uniref:Uncharacterized protein n=1 Tax=Puccinia sorghi TaxID=27349 RepID=A0A0L6UZ01_9BASI|nr:hypothetical protein VP01_3236g1 [Puccinia sorghi]
MKVPLSVTQTLYLFFIIFLNSFLIDYEYSDFLFFSNTFSPFVFGLYNEEPYSLLPHLTKPSTSSHCINLITQAEIMLKASKKRNKFNYVKHVLMLHHKFWLKNSSCGKKGFLSVILLVDLADLKACLVKSIRRSGSSFKEEKWRIDLQKIFGWLCKSTGNSPKAKFCHFFQPSHCSNIINCTIRVVGSQAENMNQSCIVFLELPLLSSNGLRLRNKWRITSKAFIHILNVIITSKRNIKTTNKSWSMDHIIFLIILNIRLFGELDIDTNKHPRSYERNILELMVGAMETVPVIEGKNEDSNQPKWVFHIEIHIKICFILFRLRRISNSSSNVPKKFTIVEEHILVMVGFLESFMNINQGKINQFKSLMLKYSQDVECKCYFREFSLWGLSASKRINLLRNAYFSLSISLVKFMKTSYKVKNFWVHVRVLRFTRH